MNKKIKQQEIKEKPKKDEAIHPKEMVERSGNLFVEGIMLPPRVVMQIADEVAKVVAKSITHNNTRRKKAVKNKKLENPTFLDTSAIIDGRVFELVKIGLFNGNLVVLEGVLGELKNIADSKDDIKKERGRRALKGLDELRKQRRAKFIVLNEGKEGMPVDDQLIHIAKKYKGRVVTCDFNLTKKAKISNVVAIDLYELANIVKTTAIPGEVFVLKIMQKGKGAGQGVGYLPDGTMVVIEQGLEHLGNIVSVEISRVIQTEAGRIFFAKIIEESPAVVSATI